MSEHSLNLRAQYESKAVDAVRPIIGIDELCREAKRQVTESMIGVRLTCSASKSRTYEMFPIENAQISE